MDTLKKGTLTVAIATIVASATILLTSNTVADNENQEISAKSMLIAPPPGPFFKGSASIASKKRALVAPIAPTEPVNNLQKPEPRPESKANSLEFKMVSPQLPLLKKVDELKQVQVPVPGKQIVAPVMKQRTPELSQKMGGAPKADGIPQSNAKKAVISSKNTPIWMQQGNGVNRSSNATTNDMRQQNNTNIQNSNYNGMPNMGWNYPAQQYMYIPVPMMVPSAMPQMPFAPYFNYGAPMPFYNNAPLDNNTSQAVNKIATPEQKGINK